MPPVRGSPPPVPLRMRVTPPVHTVVMVVMDVDRMPGAPAAGWDEGSFVPPSGIAGVRPAHVRLPPEVIRRWQPLAGNELLDRLRVTGRRRPTVDLELVSRLRVDLEGGLAEDRIDGDLPAPVVVTKDRLTAILACEAHQLVTGFGERAPTIAMACGALIDVLFRQLVTVGGIDDPMADGVAALSVDGHHQTLVSWLERLSAADRAELRAEVTRQAEGLQRRWPALEPGWLPRTQEPMRVPLLGGAMELSARVDLAIGRPAVDEGSVAIVEVKSGARRVEHRADLHYYALVETLRSAAPPFVVATYYTRTGELDVEPVTWPLLFAAAHRTAAGAGLLRDQERGADQLRRSSALCARCAALPGVQVGPAPAAGAIASGASASGASASGASVASPTDVDRTAA